VLVLALLCRQRLQWVITVTEPAVVLSKQQEKTGAATHQRVQKVVLPGANLDSAGFQGPGFPAGRKIQVGLSPVSRYSAGKDAPNRACAWQASGLATIADLVTRGCLPLRQGQQLRLSCTTLLHR
jgi:hypothetical protein